MKLDRTLQPGILPMPDFSLQQPERLIMPNGARLTVLDGGTQEVFRLDILVYGGQWRQTMPLQASFTNRMLSEGTASLTSEQIFDTLDIFIED